jgi:hypothetical protein
MTQNSNEILQETRETPDRSILAIRYNGELNVTIKRQENIRVYSGTANSYLPARVTGFSFENKIFCGDSQENVEVAYTRQGETIRTWIPLARLKTWNPNLQFTLDNANDRWAKRTLVAMVATAGLALSALLANMHLKKPDGGKPADSQKDRNEQIRDDIRKIK